MYVKEKTNKTENETMRDDFLTVSEGILVNVASCNLETQTKGSALGTWLEVSTEFENTIYYFQC